MENSVHTAGSLSAAITAIHAGVTGYTIVNVLVESWMMVTEYIKFYRALKQAI